jgi:hypothetical protein
MFIFIIVYAPVSFGQPGQKFNTDLGSLIDKKVMLIRSDSSLKKIVLKRSDIDPGFQKASSKRNEQEYYLYMDHGKIIRLEWSLSIFDFNIFGNGTSYYFDDDRLILVIESYYNQSRMGSCGGLEIENRLYYSNNKLVKKTVTEKPFACYKNDINVKQIIADLKEVLGSLKAYGLDFDMPALPQN